MIPMVAAVRVGRDDRGLRLWIPLVLVWLLLLPVVLLIAPLALLACAIGEVNPLRALRSGWDVLSSLKGLDLEIDAFELRIF
jgi:hypothetical protein